jgi:glycosyltransferase involved in cell wall biosynthesis
MIKDGLKVSIIAAVYKDVEALDLILESLRQQTYKNFELIVAEDNNSKNMKDYVDSINDIKVLHTFQEDKGIQKARSINNAILKSKGDYLIFIDGDCVVYTTFIEGHVALAEKNRVLVGRRVNLGKKMSQNIRDHKLSAKKLEKRFIGYYPQMIMDKASHLEQGVYLNPRGFLYSKLKNRKTNLQMLGCNFSCFKKDMIEINGFDESYGETAVSDDTDLQWRFEALGLKMKSCKFVANMFHLYHYRAPERYLDRMIPELERMLERKKTGIYKAKEGLDSFRHQ